MRHYHRIELLRLNNLLQLIDCLKSILVEVSRDEFSTRILYGREGKSWLLKTLIEER